MDRIFLRFLLFVAIIIALPSCWDKQSNVSIVEAHNITDIYHYLDPDDCASNTLIVFDIDNTLLTTPTDLGSAHWFYALLNKKITEGSNYQEALRMVLPEYYHAQQHVSLIPVESETIPTLHALQKCGITVIALTARGLYLFYRTLEQLHKVDIDFTQTAPPNTMTPYGISQPAIYSHGIIFASDHNKGKVLKHWIAQQHYQPKKIIFVDDVLKNVQNVAQSMKTMPSPFIGIRYGHLDNRAKNFNLHQTNLEYNALLEKHPDREPITIIP